jgi:hypothetical protein
MSKTFTATLLEDPVTGDLILPFPDDFLAELDWREGDTLNFTVNGEVVVIVNTSMAQRSKTGGA